MMPLDVHDLESRSRGGQGIYSKGVPRLPTISRVQNELGEKKKKRLENLQ